MLSRDRDKCPHSNGPLLSARAWTRMTANRGVGGQAALSVKTNLAASQLPKHAPVPQNGCLWGGQRTFD